MRHLLLLLWLAGLSAHAGTGWLTVTGNEDDGAVNTILVDPSPISLSAHQRTLRIRVNRSQQRNNWEGMPYRSYEAMVVFDCSRQTARYLHLSFYLEPNWQGTPYLVRDYTHQMPPRWMEFRDVEPNPKRRIVRAACGPS